MMNDMVITAAEQYLSQGECAIIFDNVHRDKAKLALNIELSGSFFGDFLVKFHCLLVPL